MIDFFFSTMYINYKNQSGSIISEILVDMMNLHLKLNITAVFGVIQLRCKTQYDQYSQWIKLLNKSESDK